MQAYSKQRTKSLGEGNIIHLKFHILFNRKSDQQIYHNALVTGAPLGELKRSPGPLAYLRELLRDRGRGRERRKGGEER